MYSASATSAQELAKLTLVYEQLFESSIRSRVSLNHASPMEESGTVVHSAWITIHTTNFLKPAPGFCIFLNQQPLGESIAPHSDSLEQPASAELIVVPAKSVVMKYDCKRSWMAQPLAKQSIVCRNRVCAEEDDREAVRAMIVVQLAVAFKNFQEPEGRVSKPTSFLGNVLRKEVWGPPLGCEVPLAKLDPRHSVVTEKTLGTVPKFYLQSSLSYAVIGVNEGMGTVCRAEHFHRMTIGARARVESPRLS